MLITDALGKPIMRTHLRQLTIAIFALFAVNASVFMRYLEYVTRSPR